MQLSNPSGTGWSVGPGGPALAARGDASFPSAPALASYPFTVALGMTPLSVPGSSALYLDFGSTQSGLAQIRAESGGTWGLGINSFPWDAASSVAIAPYVGTPVVAAATFGTSGSQLYLGGRLAFSTSLSGANPLNGGGSHFTLFNPVPPLALFYWCGWWGRGLSAGEHAALAANPWQVFRPQSDVARLYAATSVSRVSYPRGSSILSPAQLPTADLSRYLD